VYLTGKRKDPEPLQYDWFLNSAKTECEIRKAYEGSENTCLTFVNLWVYFLSATHHSVVLYGNPSRELIQTAKTIGVKVRTYSFLQGLD